MNQGTVPQQTSSLPTLILNFLAARPMRDKLVLFIMLEVCRNFVALWFKKKSEGSKAALLQQEDTWEDSPLLPEQRALMLSLDISATFIPIQIMPSPLQNRM